MLGPPQPRSQDTSIPRGREVGPPGTQSPPLFGSAASKGMSPPGCIKNEILAKLEYFFPSVFEVSQETC